MKRTIFSFAVLAALGLSAVGYTVLVNEDKCDMSIDVQEVEALSVCEVSSDASKNQGYCAPNYNASGDACTSTGDGGSVRCSGSY